LATIEGRSDAAAFERKTGRAGNASAARRWFESGIAVETGEEIAKEISQEIRADKNSRQGGALKMAETTYLDAIRQALFEEMERDPAVVLMGEDVGSYGGAFKVSEGLMERFGRERVIDTPISESAIVGAAIGMGYAGLRPVAEMQFIDFIACCFNIITNYAAKSHYLWGAPVPLVLRGPCGGGVHGGPFHSANPEMYFAHTPGLKIVCPATAHDAKGLLKSAIRDNNPVLFFEHKFLYRRVKEELPAADYTVPIGKAVVRREGRDLTILSYAAMLHVSLDAAAELAKEGIDAEVVDLRTLLPLDRETILASVRKTNKLLVVHEDTRTGGIAGEIAAVVTESAFEDLDGPIRRVTSIDTPVPYSPPLEDFFRPNAAKVVAAARELAHY
jgi:2-oxoisovalerate dehydrogenase E1 component beta subunit